MKGECGVWRRVPFLDYPAADRINHAGSYGVNFNGDEEKIVARLFKPYAEAARTEG